MTGYLLLLPAFLLVCIDGVSATNNDAAVMVALIIKDSTADILPQFLGTIERLNYPKEKITLWVRVDENSQTSKRAVDQWVGKVTDLYHNVRYNPNSQTRGDDQILSLKQEALQSVSAENCSYVMFVDCDVIIKDLDIIDHLIDASVIHRALVVAPLFNVYGMRYSNFWGGLSDNGGYINSTDYDAIVERKIKGCFDVPVVHTAFLVHVDSPEFPHLSFNSSKYADNAINRYHSMVGFSQSAVSQGGKLVVCNHIQYGEMSLPVSWLKGGSKEKIQNLNVALRRLAMEQEFILPSQYLQEDPSTFSKDFDMVYIINLKKRTHRRAFMEQVMHELGVKNYKIFEATDGKSLNDSYLIERKVKVIDGYREPWTQRHHLTDGEIGCFLSHYSIWKEALDMEYKTVLILEDDATPAQNMLEQYSLMREDLTQRQGLWDLLYLGRKLTTTQSHSIEIKGLKYLVKPRYSYWLVAYALNRRGIEKILSHEPLSKMLPVDEYIPILYNEHPNEEWKSKFNPRDLVALSAEPRLMFPSHYPGDRGYSSDTEHIEPQSRHEEL